MKICVCDVDGTLVNDYGKLNKFTKDVLIEFQKQGNLLILASGRSYNRMMSIALDLQMDIYNGFLIDVNGISIYSFSNNKRERFYCLDKNIQKKFFEHFKKLNIEIKFYGDESLYTYLPEDLYELKKKIRYEMKLPEDYPWISGEYSLLADNRDGYPNQKLIKDIAEIDYKVNKVGLCACHEKLVEIQNDYNKNKVFDNFELIFSANRQIDIININYSKGSALKYLLNKYNLANKKIYIFGDSENDISMLNLSENSYLMDNSKIKSSKFKRTLSNNDDGVAKIIQKII